MNCPTGLANPCANNLSGASANFFLTLINTLLATQCTYNSQEKYPTDYSTKIQNNEEFDFIIIGSGSAGSVVANKLTENPNWKVLILEAGTYPSSTSEIPGLLFSVQGTEEDWQYTTEPSNNACLSYKDKKCRWPRGKSLGGSGMMNAMLYVRGNSRDYNHWAELGNDGWDYNSVLKYFKANENLQSKKLENSSNYGRDGYQTLMSYDFKEPIKKIIQKSAEELGYPTILEVEENGLGYFETIDTTNGKSRENPAASFLGKIKNRKNLFVATNAFVERLIEVTPKDFRGVLVKIGNRKMTLLANKELILSAGVINSPQLLMLSGIGPKQHLQELGIKVIANLQVGKNLQDHTAMFGFFVKIPTTPAIINPSSSKQYQAIDHLYRYFMYQRGPLATISLTNLLGFINTKNDSSSQYPNLQIHHVLHPEKDIYLLAEFLRVIGIEEEIIKKKLKHNQQSTTIHFIPTLLNPKSRGEILLKTKNPKDKPLIYLNYFENSEDLETLLEGIRYLERLLLSTESFTKHSPEIVDLKIANCQNFEFRSDDYWRCFLRNLVSTMYHPVGTCKMGPKTDPGAVVDSRLRVHGIKNLRVIDASIMPVITSGNTQAPVMMIGQKGGVMIQEDWNKIEHHEL